MVLLAQLVGKSWKRCAATAPAIFRGPGCYDKEAGPKEGLSGRENRVNVANRRNQERLKR